MSVKVDVNDHVKLGWIASSDVLAGCAYERTLVDPWTRHAAVVVTKVKTALGRA